MHGNYPIKVVRGDQFLFNYVAPCHPVEGQTINVDEYEYLVNGVSHVLKWARNGSARYYTIDYVEVKVY